LENITYRLLKAPAELEQAVDLQSIYWGQDAAALVPLHMLLSLARYGGHVIGAFDDARMVGLLIGFLGYESGQQVGELAVTDLVMMSKRMVVLPDYRGYQIGYNLKCKQREIALKLGISSINWTFDPMLARNAHLNIRKLGGIIQKYIVNYFGESETNPTLTADRLVVEWLVNHPHVRARIETDVSPRTLEMYLADSATIVNPIRFDDEMPYSTAHVLKSAKTALIEIPRDFMAVQTMNAELAAAWRLHVRDIFEGVMSRGFIVTDFVRGFHEGQNRTFYALTHRDTLDISIKKR